MALWLGVLLAPALLAGGPMVSPPPGQQVVVEIPVFQGGEGMDFFLQCARDYEALWPKVSVNGKEEPQVAIDLYGDPRIADKVRVRVLEGTFPDASNAFINYWPLIKHGDVLALDEWMDGPNWEGDSTWRDSFIEGALTVYNVDGHVFGCPFFSSVFCIWYNRAMFEEHGWKPATTWDELYALSQQIQDAGITPFAFQGRYPGYAQALVERAYYDLAGRDSYYAMKDLEPGSFDREEWVTALCLTRKLARNWFQPGCLGMSHTESQQEFFNGRTAMIPCGAWLKSEMLGKIPGEFRLGSFNLPYIPDSKQDPSAITIGTNYYFVFAGAKHKDYAVDFLRFMTSREESGKFARMQDFPVLTKRASEGNVSEDMTELVAMTNAAKEAYGQPPGEGYPEMGQHLNDFIAKLMEVAGQGGGEAKEADDRAFCEDLAKRYEQSSRSVRYRSEHPMEITVNYRKQPAIFLGLLGIGAIYALWSTFGPRGRKAARGTADAAATSSALRLRWSNIVLFVAPAAVLYTVFVVWPSLQSFGWSLTHWDGLTEREPCGLNNYLWLLFDSRVFWGAVKNNLFLMFLVPAVVLPVSLFLAACLSRGLWGSTAFRIIFFFPNLMGSVAVVLLWTQIYNPHGPVSAVWGAIAGKMLHWGVSLAGLAPDRAIAVLAMGHSDAAKALAEAVAQSPGWLPHAVSGLSSVFANLEAIAWLDAKHLYRALIPMSVWGACGFNMILYLAAMESVPVSLYEAADLDGAPIWKQFWGITFPLIWDVLAVSIVLTVIGGVKAFDTIWLFTNQATPSDLHVIGTYMVSSMFNEYKVGQATAIAVLLFLMVFIGTTATLRAMRRERVEL